MKRKINEIIIHCTDTEFNTPVEKIDVFKWHVKERGLVDIGYHYLITLDGRVIPCRPLYKVGAHCKGHNSYSVGVCYAGGRFYGQFCDTRTSKQKDSLLHLIEDLCQLYPITSISGHCDYARRSCPCFDAKNEYSHLIKKLL